MTEEYTIKGKPLSECTDAELCAEWEAGMWFDCQEGLTKAQEAKHLAVEQEMTRRERPDT